MFGLWDTFNDVVFYLILLVSAVGTVGNGLVIWYLGFRIRKGPFTVYLLHLALADFLFVACQLVFLVEELAQGSQNPLYVAITFLFFAVGLWLLASFNVELCLSAFLPGCYKACRLPYTSWIVCILVWALTMPVVLLPANACGLLYQYTQLFTCLRYHTANVTWLSILAAVVCASSVVITFWTSCCPPSLLPKFSNIAQSSSFVFFFCGLPYLLCWALRRFLNFLLPFLPPLTSLLACVYCSYRPITYFMLGRQPGRCQNPGVVLQRALGEEAPRSARSFNLPLRRL